MKKAVLIIIRFILLTVLGTIMHEIGHIIPAKILGYQTTLHYGSMGWHGNYEKYSNTLLREYSNFTDVPKNKLEELSTLKERRDKDKLWISLGGPIQTMGTGIIGLFILFIRRNKLRSVPFGLVNWVAVFLSLFWSRQVFNLMIGITGNMLNSNNSMFGGDEAAISLLLNLPKGLIGIITGVIGVIICVIVVFKIIPKEDQMKFIISGILGSAIGYTIWFHGLGPIILP